MKEKSFGEMVVWQKAMLWAKSVYCLQKHLPKAEVYGLHNQNWRAVVIASTNWYCVDDFFVSVS